MQKIKGRISPAMVVAMLALIAAVSGVAFAGGKGKPITKKKARALATRIADERIAAAAPNLTVKSAGNAGSLRMFGHVSAAGALSNSSGIGFATFSTAGNPLYCLGGFAAAPKGGEVTVDGDDAGTEHAQLGFTPPSSCPAGTQAYVLMINQAGGFTDAGFWIELWS
jgi:hypothetical protein